MEIITAPADLWGLYSAPVDFDIDPEDEIGTYDNLDSLLEENRIIRFTKALTVERIPFVAVSLVLPPSQAIKKNSKFIIPVRIGILQHLSPHTDVVKDSEYVHPFTAKDSSEALAFAKGFIGEHSPEKCNSCEGESSAYKANGMTFFSHHPPSCSHLISVIKAEYKYRV